MFIGERPPWPPLPAAAVLRIARASAPGGLVGEQDDERIVARNGADLVVESGLVDGLGDRVGRPGLAGEHEDQAAAADDDGDVGQDPAQALVGRPGASGAEGLEVT